MHFTVHISVKMRKSVRLSEERCKLNKEKIAELQIKRDEKDLGLEIRQFRNKGRGVITKNKKFRGITFVNILKNL